MDGDPLNGTDPTGLSKCGQFSLGGLVDCASKARVPDYVVLNPSVCVTATACFGANVTITRNGHVYAGYETGAAASAGGVGGLVSIRAGWINQQSSPGGCKIDGFVNGSSLTSEGFVPIGPVPGRGGIGPDLSVTLSANPDGTYSTATEIGVGAGAGKSVSFSHDRVRRIL